jgi:hypothetical protein
MGTAVIRAALQDMFMAIALGTVLGLAIFWLAHQEQKSQCELGEVLVAPKQQPGIHYCADRLGGIARVVERDRGR